MFFIISSYASSNSRKCGSTKYLLTRKLACANIKIVGDADFIFTNRVSLE